MHFLAKVKQIAGRLRRKSWDIKTDIGGFEQPAPIGKNGKIPDIVAKKRGAKKIIEVETLETMGKDKKQHETFRRSAAHQRRDSFEIEET
ncbi:hypothetical protein ES702_02263 [subsurface metagenome]